MQPVRSRWRQVIARSLFLSDDNEGNGYHGMFFTLTVITPDNVDEFEGFISDNAEPNIHNIIVVG